MIILHGSESLDYAQVYKKILEGEIVTIKPQKNGKNYELYTVCRKLKWANSGKIVRHFFLCINCENVLNINLSTHHNVLKRHCSKCNNASDKMAGPYSMGITCENSNYNWIFYLYRASLNSSGSRRVHTLSRSSHSIWFYLWKNQLERRKVADTHR